MRVRGLGTLSLHIRHVKTGKKEREEILGIGVYSQNNDVTYLEMMLDPEQELKKKRTLSVDDILCILASAKWPSEKKDPLFPRHHHIPHFLLLNFNFCEEDFWDWDLQGKCILIFQIRGRLLNINGCLKKAAQLLQKAARGEQAYPE